MRRESSEQELPLLANNPRNIATNSYANIAEHTVCLLVAFPTAALNSLAAILGDSATTDNLHTPEDLLHRLDEASAARIVYGVIALSASEAVLYFLNKRYLFASGKAAFDLLKRTTLTLKSICCRYDVAPKDRAGIGENGLFLWSIVTSLIFAEMGGKALSFLGLPGEIIGFSLNLSVYFATRFASAKMFVDNINDANWQLKQRYLSKLESLRPNDVAIRIDLPNNNINHALVDFLTLIDDSGETLSKDRKKVFWLQGVAPVLGYMLAVMTILPIVSGFIPESVQGAELLTNSNIGSNNYYQNTGSLTFGIFSTALTLFFYELNIKELPKHFLTTALSIYEKIKSNDIAAAMKLFFLTVFALGASYLSGIGFKLIADTAVNNGYLSYLGTWLSSTIPNGLLIAVVAMLWSHLQTLVNQTAQTHTPLDINNLASINMNNVQELLRRPDTDILALR